MSERVEIERTLLMKETSLLQSQCYAQRLDLPTLTSVVMDALFHVFYALANMLGSKSSSDFVLPGLSVLVSNGSCGLSKVRSLQPRAQSCACSDSHILVRGEL